MARRKSRGSKVSSKRSRRGRRVMNRSERRSKVSRKRSRVSRTNKRTSRVQRRGKRSRTKRGGARRAGGGRGAKQERPVHRPGDLIMTPRSGAEAVAADARAARLAGETAALEAKAAEDRAYVLDMNARNLRTWQSKLDSADAGVAAKAKEKVAYFESLLK